jgi:acetolactate synthase-1/2/3 large subunit
MAGLLKENRREYVSDLVADLLRCYGVEYVALNPGSTFRGIQDSIVNYLGNVQPMVVEVCHEEIAVAIAHGYFKAKRRPMAVLLHDVVGLLHASMAIFNAWCDDAAILLLGGVGPMDAAKRRPWIDWVHTALIPADLVRDYIKWDDQPFSPVAVVESFARAYKTAVTPPAGPVLLYFDVELQESRLEEDVRLIGPEEYPAPTPPSPNVEAIKEVAKMIVDAELPAIVVEFLGRNPEAVERLVDFSNEIAVPVVDRWATFNFPNTHPMDLTGSDILSKADLIVAFDVKDLFGALNRPAGSRYENLIRDDAKVVTIGLYDYRINRGTITDYQRINRVNISITSDSSQAIRMLTELCRERLRAERGRIEERYASRATTSRELRKAWVREAEEAMRGSKILLPAVSLAVWRAVRDFDWVVTAGSIGRGRPPWERKVWEFDRWGRYFGTTWGAGLGYNLPASIGVALALKQGLFIDLQPDGDLLYTATALWTASNLKLPILVIVLNNKMYGNDYQHSISIAKARNRPTLSARIGNVLEDPEIDFTSLAKAFGCHGFGPYEKPSELEEALRNAAKVTIRDRKPVIVDVYIENVGER